ncbi:beta-1,6-N-acetylglucosaminyltransferase [Sulfitobacter geojensis]|uniref:Peptide O-xylosyltransferase n=1 Tax=Sulfitobacter geojensis TaxID=1342299 RepID=A0AAE3B5Z8_9RHOB|nr:beta-1,6-N-acetylglucosaminyltransferase [Sulfitobacter geojensis]MBM1689327.1 glycosyl transferase [Sulfitobacter geojensis]MBM1693393.1 glycosyl transferase [Sulfitobacter geojensis]MBM1705559.1 glycosyl transferase [Sulfitobacter geojensis]MBM1709617.1 glycosyl transferase [Sulfitobacter geojensis]MBM1713683.1 glycosyl transferase [Sulfitobacter geojensis]
MSVGIVMLVHTALGRAEQVARHWSAAGCPVVIHVDKVVERKTYESFVTALSDLEHVSFSTRYRCEWGTWGIVQATQAASEQMLAQYAQVRHVYLASGSCLPLRPIEELLDYLRERPQTDFIESATTSEVPWTVGGLDEERFTLRFPVSWKRNRHLFDFLVNTQRSLGLQRKMPNGIVPHMGSQWWCLTRRTLSAILQDPERPTYDRFFRHVWIPDESFFQTLARHYSSNIESRSLTLSKFDFQGKPHIFYDDHLQLLRRSDCFVARKIWPYADRLYEAFLTDAAGAMKKTEPNPGKIDRIFSKAVERRTRGRSGLYMQSRFPNEDWENGVTAAPYSMFQGFAELFENFEPWLASATGARVHGHLFAKDKVHYADGQTAINGALSDSAVLRDYNGKGFLTNLIWNTRGERQCFQFGPADNQDICWRVAKDPNAQVSVITGAWAVPLFRSNRDFADIRAIAANLQKLESEHMDILRSPYTKARVRIWTMAEFIEAPMEPLQGILDEIGRTKLSRLSEAPKMVDLAGFGQFLQNLKNQGMHPYLMGDFPVERGVAATPKAQRKPYLVQ